jgi:hypothetical protein
MVGIGIDMKQEMSNRIDAIKTNVNDTEQGLTLFFFALYKTMNRIIISQSL